MPGYTLADGLTLKNKLRARNHGDLEIREAAPVARRILEIKAGFGPEETYDAAHLKALHHHIFQDVFEWSGHTRDERIQLSDSSVAYEPTLHKLAGKPFAPSPKIATALSDFTAAIRNADLTTETSREHFTKHAAILFSSLNTIHPFREGNGRTQRLFFEQLASRAGHPIDFNGITHRRMIDASVAAHEHGDISVLYRMLDEIANPSRSNILREGLMKLTNAAQKFGWKNPNDAYVTTFTPGEIKTVTLAGIAGNQFMARSDNQIFFGRTINLPRPLPTIGQQFTHHEPAGNDHPPDDPSDGLRKPHPAKKSSGKGGLGN